jgi:PAS domain S-box-containing protein
VVPVGFVSLTYLRMRTNIIKGLLNNRHMQMKQKSNMTKGHKVGITRGKSKVETSSKNFPIVGIGASAGGLEAFVKLLEALPVDTGMAFIFVQHLDPTHESLGPHIFSRSTRMQVLQVEDGIRVNANCIYLIPPNHNMMLTDGVLSLLARTESCGQHLVIDSFFQSLARDQRGRAIGVVLSGTASDGTEGLKAIKAMGGLTIAQDPKTAGHWDMPKNAIDSGAVDLILSPEQIAHELARISKHPYIANACESQSKTQSEFSEQSDDKEEAEPQLDDSLRKIFTILHLNTGVDFSNYKSATIRRRIHRRMMVRKTDSFEAYAKYLRENNEEIKSLYNDILINVTEFFRDPESFKELVEHVFPKLIKKRDLDSPIRIWIAACATGEEVYSMAILLVEFLAETGSRLPIQIFATDISEPCLQKARAGLYSESSLQGVSKDRIKRFFEKVDGGYKISKGIRELCLFSRHDLNADPAFGKLDLISCRNILIYFKPILQKRIISIFHYALKADSFLWLGRSEGICGEVKLFTLLDKAHKIYSKNNVLAPMNFRFPITPYVSEANESFPVMPKVPKESGNFQRDLDRITLAKYAPPSVVVNAAMEILQFQGKTSAYLQNPTGAPSNNLFKMAIPELVHSLQRALQEAKTNNINTRHESVIVDLNGNDSRINIEVIPANPQAPLNQRKFLIFFENHPSPSLPAKKKGANSSTKVEKEKGSRNQADQRIARLEQDALTSKLYQQALFEDFEAALEELTAGNEELQSTNEELQSTNEELETAKEEVQSTNEELTTVNDELQNRNAELTVLTSDLNNILASSDIPLVIVDGEHRVRRFTPQAVRVFNFIDSDIGRPLANIRATFDLNLDGLVSEVIESLMTQEREIQDNTGHWMRLQIRPFKTIDSRIDGAVITLLDIHVLKTSLNTLQEREKSLAIETKNVRFFESITVAANEATSVDGALQIFLEEICKHAQFSIGHAYLPAKDGSGKFISSKVWYLDDPNKFTRFKEGNELLDLELASGVGMQGKVVSTQNFVSTNDLNLDLVPQKAKLAAEVGIRSALSFPVFVDDVIVAVLEFFSKESAKPDPKVFNIISHVTPQLSRVFERKRTDEVRDELLQSHLMIQKAIENERENFRNLFEQTPEMLCILSGPDHVFEFVNGAHVKALGFNATGMSVRAAQPETVETHRDLDIVYRTGKTIEYHDTPMALSGRRRFFSSTLSARRDQSGQINGVMILSVEVTEQVQARKKIEEYARELEVSQKESADILESTADGFIALDKNYTVLKVNGNQERITGLSRDKTVGKNHWEIWPRETIPKIGQAYEKIIRERVPVRIEDFNSALKIWLAVDAYPTPNGGLAAFFRDITSEKNAQLTIQSQRDRFNRLAAASGIGVWYCDLPFSDLNWDEKVKEHFWLPPCAHVTIDTFYERIHPEDRERTRKAIEDSIQSHSIYNVEYRTFSPDNESAIKWIRAVGWTDYSSSGAPVRFDGITLDITVAEEQKAALEAALRSRDVFLSIASHELRTPITGMKIRTQMFKRAIRNNSPHAYEPIRVTEMVDALDYGLDRMTRLIEDMLDISKIQLGKLSLQCEPTDITKLVSEVIERMRPWFTSVGITVHTKLTEGLYCNLDRFRFEQVLTNLATNSIRYAPSAPVEVELKREANHVVLRFRDHGPGVPQVDHENIFKRFERRVSADKTSGMGLGLYICREILKSHGGTIRIDGETSPGTCFLIELPIEVGAGQ